MPCIRRVWPLIESAMPEVRVGIAGYGTVGRIRRRCVEAEDGMAVVAICDQVVRVPGEVEGGVRCWRTPEDLLRNEELDALFVCLPNYLAPSTVVTGLEHGLHVFCEKPPGRSVADIAAMREAELATDDRILMFGFNHRYHDSVIAAKEIIESRELGDVIDLRGVYGKSAIIRYAPGEWRSQRMLAGGGILLDQGIHMIDLVRFLGGEFDEVHSFVSNAHWKHDVEDNAYVLMKSSSGVVAMVHSSATQWRHRFQLDITLSGGAIVLAGLLTSTKSYGAETVTVVYPTEGQFGDPKEITTRFNDDPSWMREVAEFHRAIANPAAWPRASSLEALETMDLIDRIYRADPVWRDVVAAEAETERVDGRE